MPSYPHIERYYEDLQKLIDFGGSTNEQSIRPAFAYCLDAYCREHRERMVLVPELALSSGVRPDGAVKDSLRMTRGYWEAKDTHDDLDAEIQRKFNRGYPQDNIVFEDSQTAVLFQNGGEAMRVDMRRPGELHRLIRTFLDYELPEIEEFRGAWHQFKADLPTVLASLRETVAEAEAANPAYQVAAAAFLELCRQTISPDVSKADVREMLLQHILTKDIFLRVFAEEQFHRENNVARHLDALEQTFFTGDVRRNAIDRLRAYYGAVGRAADEIADYAEKQQFLKAIYEDFYKTYNPDAADRLGVVYTPNEIVDFMIRGTDYLLRKHFGRGLADENVQILDPATGTGTFITNLINYLPPDRLEHKYLHEMHANEVAILPYYIANLNIEYTYKERTGRYLEFPNLCFVDTLDNMDWQQTGATSGVVQRQSTFNLGAISEENRLRVQEQNAKPISVIIGNPPYNANQQNWNDNNPNVVYPAIDQRIQDTYVKESTAQKTKQYDMYKRFIRWASDRLDDNGIIAFVSNRAYLEARQDDGFRQVMCEEFSDLYILDLGSDVRRNPKIAGTTHNVFGIQTGVAIGFFIRNSAKIGPRSIHYARREDAELATDKLAYLHDAKLDGVPFENILPDAKNNWLNQTSTDFGSLAPLVNRQTRLAKTVDEEDAVFGLYSMGVSTNRDEWVYDFDPVNLRSKVLLFADIYNRLLDKTNLPDDPIIKWSRDLRNEFRRGWHIVYNDANYRSTLYRPFILKQHFADFTMNDVLTTKHYEIFGLDLCQANRVINLCQNGNTFYALASDRVVDLHFTGDTHCLPLYRYPGDGRRVNNITQWGLRQFNDHYRKEWGDAFERLYPAGIGPDDIFAYTYAVLHDPVYRHDYAADLLREFPRLPFYHAFDAWARMGHALLDLHIGFESAEPYPLEREETGKEPDKPKLRAGRARGVIVLDDATRLAGVPEDAWRYRLGNRSALEWVLDQYKERKPKDPTIAARFDTYRFADHKDHVTDLLRRVCTVSVKTMEIVDGMAYWDGDDLVVFGDRGKHEMASLGLSQWFSKPEDPEWEAAWSET